MSDTTSEPLAMAEGAASDASDASRREIEESGSPDAQPAVPETPEAYSFTRPDLPEGVTWDEGLEAAFRQSAHGLGLDQAQAQGLLEAFATYQGQSVQAGEAAQAATAEALEQDLRAEWGADYDAHLDTARRAARAFAGDEATMDALSSAMGEAGVVRFFHRIGALMSEDTMAGESEPGLGLGPEGARAEARAIETKLAGLIGRHDGTSQAERRRLEAERRSLLARAYG